MGSRQKSTVGSESDTPELQFPKMEAIKKKMQAMKVEKDNACDQADVSEEKMKAARIRAQKGEDEVEELLIKSRQLETELDMTAERLGIATLQLEEKEKQLAATELEMNALTRRVSGLEEDLEKTEEKMVAAVAKLTRLEPPLTTLSVPRRCSRARPMRTRRGSLALRRTSRRRGRRPRLPMPPTMRLPRSLPPASPTSRRLRSVPMWVGPRSLTWRRSRGFWPTT